ncbi:MAG: hypothetical protein AAFX80_18555 [Cyanobacteria bacterium J06639_18]
MTSKSDLGVYFATKTEVSVKEISDAQAFNVSGARCQVLVTTREAAIADALGASTYNLDVMTPEQAIELLTKLSK